MLYTKIGDMVVPADWAVFTARALAAKAIGFDTETDGSTLVYKDRSGKKKSDFLHPLDHRMVGFSIAFDNGDRYYAPIRHKTGSNIDAVKAVGFLRDLFARKDLWVAVHNWEFDLGVLNREGLDIQSQVVCTKVLGWILGKEQQYGSLRLKDLIEKITGKRPLDFSDVVKGAQSSDARSEDMATYAADDAWNTLYLLRLWYSEAKTSGLWAPFREILMPLILVIRHQVDTGLWVDCAQLEQFQKDLWPQIADINLEWDFLVGIRQTRREALAQRLYREFRWWPESSITLTEAGGLPTDGLTLADLLDHPETTGDGRRAIELLQAGESARKLVSTYIFALFQHANFFQDQRVRCGFAFADTGRFRSFNPNMQNLPRPNPKLPNIRAVFKPRPGFTFVCADYEQLELRILAGISQDPLLLSAFQKGIDLHQATADRWQVSRSRAKTLNFATIYGITKFGLSRKFGVSKEEAQKDIDRYFATYTGVKQYVVDRVREARQSQGVRTYMGRFRDLSAYKDGALERRAGNTPIQGSAADATNLAMVRLYRLWKDKGWLEKDAFIPMSVHDEILCEVRSDLVPQAKEDISWAMEGALPNFPLTLAASIGSGQNWHEAKK